MGSFISTELKPVKIVPSLLTVGCDESQVFQQIAEALRIIQRPAGGFGKIHSCKGFFFRKSAWEKREIIVCFSKGYFFNYIKGNFVSLGGVTSPVLTESVLHYIFFRFQKTKYQMEAWIGQKIPDVKQFSENIIRMSLFW